jgi:hypothetical protein
MQEITAYEDSSGRLHKRKREAVVADFIIKIQTAWGAMPDQRDRGDPVVIARILSSSTYPSVRIELSEALEWLDEQFDGLND